jgi:chromosomal replication initiation ATPase DnaA
VTLPELFAAQWEATGGDLLTCVHAVIDADAKMKRRPRMRVVSDEYVEGLARKIIAAVCARSKIPVELVMGKSRVSAVARVRQDAMLMCHEMLDLGPTAVGDIFKRDHSTAIAAFETARERILARPALGASLRQVASAAIAEAAAA